MNGSNQPRRLSMKLHSLYMAFLFPTFLLITVLMGVNNYYDKYDIIQANFGAKLEAVSLVAGAFLNGEPFLEDAIAPYQPDSLATDHETGRMYGYDRANGALLEIDPQFGGAVIHSMHPNRLWVDLSFDSKRKRLLAVTGEGTVEQVPIDGEPETQQLFSLNEAVSGLAYDDLLDRYLIWANGLVELDPESGEVERLSSHEGASLVSLAYDSSTQSLAALVAGDEDEGANGIALIDQESGALRSREPFQYAFPPSLNDEIHISEADAWMAKQYDRIVQSGDNDAIQAAEERLQRIAVRLRNDLIAPEAEAAANDPGWATPEASLRGLAMHPSEPIWLSASASLAAVEPSTFKLWRHGCFSGYVDELDRDMLMLLSPLRRAKSKLNLTYLYTFYRPENAGPLDIIYTLDANIDTDHSFSGDADVLPEDSVYDMYGRILLDELYLSEIVEWEEWGLIKTGYAPILDSANLVNHVIGADINVSIIETRTRVFLLQTIAIGTLLFAITIMISFWVARAMIRPIQSLNETALAVAAGEYGLQAPVSGPTEFRNLCRAFNGLSDTMKETEEKRNFDNQVLQFQTARAELIRKLTRIRDSWEAPVRGQWRARHYQADRNMTPVSFAVACGQGMFGWTGGAESSSLNTLKIQLDIALTVRSMAVNPQWSDADWNDALERWHDETVEVFYRIDASHGRFHCLKRIDLSLARITPGAAEPVIVEGESCEIAPGDLMVMTQPVLMPAVEKAINRNAASAGAEELMNAIEDSVEQMLSEERLQSAGRACLIQARWEAS